MWAFESTPPVSCNTPPTFIDSIYLNNQPRENKGSTIYVAILCSGYDTHLILSAVKPSHRKSTVTPNNMEHYTSFTINDITFIDSCQFMLSSFDKLFYNLSNKQFRYTRKYLESFDIQ